MVKSQLVQQLNRYNLRRFEKYCFEKKIRTFTHKAFFIRPFCKKKNYFLGTFSVAEHEFEVRQKPINSTVESLQRTQI